MNFFYKRILSLVLAVVQIISPAFKTEPEKKEIASPPSIISPYNKNSTPEITPLFVNTHKFGTESKIIPPPTDEQINKLLTFLKITSPNPTQDELYKSLELANVNNNPTLENSNIENIIKQLKTNTTNYLDTMPSDLKKSYKPWFPTKDDKKLTHIYNIQKKLEKSLIDQLEAILPSLSEKEITKVINKLTTLTIVTKYSRTDENINNLGYYDPNQNTLVIFPDNIWEKCQGDETIFQQSITTFFKNFIMFLQYDTSYNTQTANEPIEIPCFEPINIALNSNLQSDIAKLLLLATPNTTFEELEHAILEQDITKVYKLLQATTKEDFYRINQTLASIHNRNKSSSVLKNLVIAPTKDQYQDLIYTFQAGIEKIIATKKSNPQITLEQTLAAYNVLKNIIAQPLYGIKEEELSIIAPTLIQLDAQFLNDLSQEYKTTKEEIEDIQNSGKQLLTFLNLTAPNKETLSKQEQEEVNELNKYFKPILQLLQSTPNLTAFEWKFSLTSKKASSTETETTSQIDPPPYNYHFNQELTSDTQTSSVETETNTTYQIVPLLYNCLFNQELTSSTHEVTPTTSHSSLTLRRNI